MKLSRLVLFIFGTIISVFSFAQTGKRGIAYGRHSAQDLEVLSPEVSWWYNWSVMPESSVLAVFQNYGFEFVPMAWNGNYNEDELRNFLTAHPETKYILAFNEPNFISQANMTPSQAAAQWPKLEAIADEFNLEIVAPAVNYCADCVSENGTTYTDPLKYLDDFFSACPDCRVDYIAVHCYMNTTAALQWYIGEFKKYGKPVWLTEFAGWEPNGNISSLNDQMNFMIGAVDYLEANPNVFRYAWFTGRGAGSNTYPFIDLLGANGKLTALGEVYTQMPVHEVNKVVEIPGVIEAEAYNAMSGIRLEKTADTTGFLNVGYFDSGDWLEYKINVPETGNYKVSFRVAATKTSIVNFLADGYKLFTQIINSTGGWQQWTTVSSVISLESGEHKIVLQSINDGFNLNWFRFESLSTGIADLQLQENRFTVFPNPGKGIFQIRSVKDIKELQVISLTGKKIRSIPFSHSLDLNFLAPGVYFVRAIGMNGNPVAFQKIVKQ